MYSARQEIDHISALSDGYVQDGSISRFVTEFAPRIEPFERFGRWFCDAVTEGVTEPNVVVLATAAASGKVAARVVLLHSFSPSGFAFFTDPESRKVREITENPHAAMLSYWKEMRRQIRIEGVIVRTPAIEAEGRLRLNGDADITPSHDVVLKSCSLLAGMFDDRLRAWKEQQSVSSARPIGFELSPTAFEFWEGQTDRLNDRTFYLQAPGGWTRKGGR
ncbi:MAG: pyridoxamine 5'-phosphate oxidase family protein [Acidobacteria bacterium]|nr:pyridoxamine 5'-phosphate oxidase family protein [Acidobacteriota bacterium]